MRAREQGAPLAQLGVWISSQLPIGKVANSLIERCKSLFEVQLGRFEEANIVSGPVHKSCLQASTEVSRYLRLMRAELMALTASDV